MRAKQLAWVVSAAAVVAVAVFAVSMQMRPSGAIRDARSSAPAELQAVLWPEARPVAAFHMLTQGGAAFGPEQFRGQWNFVFFGYLSCPDVCPTTLQTLADFRRRLLAADPAAARYRFVFVSVDPTHDTPERMAGYIGYFDRDFLGLSGTAAELARLAGSMGVAYAERVDGRGVRTIDHSTSVLVVDPAGRVTGGLPAPHDPAQMLALFEALRQHLGG
ncbi:MAG: SCO family protein [Gammaproteobacteria bacterium]|nr:SCO family protein [Gammaproteobacteria bacterium]